MELTNTLLKPTIDLKFRHLPRHVGFMMDGNGRWAREHELHRLEGHRCGTMNIRRVLDACARYGVRVVTLYVFSTENWGRPREEIDGIFGLLAQVIDREMENFLANGVRLMHSGSLDGIPQVLARKVMLAVQATETNSDYMLNVAFNYGGRAEILRAAREILRENIQPDSISEESFQRHLYTNGLGDIDLIIRTGGDERLSNFFPWQASSGFLYVTPTYWPDFDADELRQALAAYDEFMSLPQQSPAAA